MARLHDYTETLTSLQNRLLAVDRDKKEALRKIDALLNRVAAAEKAATSASQSFQNAFKENQELKEQIIELETLLGSYDD